MYEESEKFIVFSEEKNTDPNWGGVPVVGERHGALPILLWLHASKGSLREGAPDEVG